MVKRNWRAINIGIKTNHTPSLICTKVRKIKSISNPKRKLTRLEITGTVGSTSGGKGTLVSKVLPVIIELTPSINEDENQIQGNKPQNR
jgi:hypothetical protein